jgi:alkanesulfonate monooxygenase SsuD/methylene tetrahydromethanopterin reductase-like flavin-dependent oxidoreductase (luciferase family)
VKRSILYQIGSSEETEFDVILEEVLLAEELGIDTVWCFPAAGPKGDFSGSAPSIWLSGLASRTERIRLGWGLADMTPPQRPPMRFAEQAASIDVASKGRLDVALLPEAELVATDTGSWEEGMRMLVDMWDAPAFSWTSARFSVQPVDVVPKPIQDPHPPLWLAGWSGDHAKSAGAAGLAFLDVSGGTDETLRLHRDLYTEARAGADPHDLVATGFYGIAVELESTAKGREQLEGWEEAGIDQVVVRAGPLEGGHDEARARIRFLASEDTAMH